MELTHDNGPDKNNLSENRKKEINTYKEILAELEKEALNNPQYLPAQMNIAIIKGHIAFPKSGSYFDTASAERDSLIHKKSYSRQQAIELYARNLVSKDLTKEELHFLTTYIDLQQKLDKENGLEIGESLSRQLVVQNTKSLGLR